jgi:NadR type nicotinamide-nucleotide adenylyltransferase
MLGVTHQAIDADRRSVPTSGSAIRADPFGNWHYLPPPVRAHYVVRVVLTGSESAGKTTLAADLAKHYGTVWSPEWAREYLDAKMSPLDESDIEPIARGQIAAEDNAARQANRVVFHDTDLLSTVIYARHYYGYCPEWIVEAARSRRPGLYLLCDIDVPWQPDPQRDRGDRREEMQELFRDAVKESGVRWVEIRGDRDERLKQAIETIEQPT